MKERRGVNGKPWRVCGTARGKLRAEGGVDVLVRGSLLCELGEVSIEGFLRKREMLEVTW